MIAVLVVASPFLISAAQANPESSAFVWTDKKEYYPSETAYIFGYGFNAYAQVTVTIQRPDLSQDTIITSTDEFGYFVCQYQLDGIHGTYNVTATDGINTAETTFENCLRFRVKWRSSCCWYIWAKATHVKTYKTYYVKYFDPAGIERRTSPTYTGVSWFEDNFTILPSLPKILGWWTVKLYENSVLITTKQVYVEAMVWTTDSTYNTLVTSFAQGETIYFKAIGLQTTKYYRFRLDRPDKTKIYVGDWTTGVTNLTGSYVLPTDAQIGSWKLHVREADDSSGTGEHHYVDTCYFEVTTAPPPPPQYYLTVQTDPANITTIPGEGWYTNCTYVNLTAPELVPGPSDGIQFSFHYWDVDGESQGEGNSTIQVHMNMNHTATAHYITQYYLNMTSDLLGVTIPAGTGWYDAGTNASIFAPEFVGITPGASRYRFDGWTTADMTEIADPSATNTTVLMDKAKTVTANYVTQYHLTVKTDPANVTTILGEDWYDNCTYVNLTAPEFVPNATGVGGQRYRFGYWDVDGANVSGNPITVHIDANHTATAHYILQYLVTFNQTGLDATAIGTVVTINDAPKNYSDLPFSIWVDNGSSVTYEYSAIVSSTVPGKRFRLDSISSPSSPFTVTGPVTITGNYKTQYQLTVRTNGLGTNSTNVYNGTTVLGTATDATPYTNWFDAGSSLQLNIDSPITVGSTRFAFTHWSGNASGTSRPLSLTMSSAKDITANYKTQYYLTMSTNFGTVAPGSGWQDAGSTVQISASAPSVVDGERYVWLGWTGSGNGSYTGMDNPANITMNGPITETAAWRHEYKLTVTSPHGSPTPTTGWFEAGISITASVNSPVSGPSGTRYVCTGWTGTGSVPASGTTTSVTFTINEPSGITWNWKTQYLLTVRTDPTGLSPQPTRNPLGEAGPGGWWYDSTTSVQLTAQPIAGYDFLNWDVDTTPVSGNPITVPMDGPHVATAHYKPSVVVKPVGGYALPINIDVNASNSLVPQIGLAFALLAAMAATILLTKRRSKTLK